jgi:hypothetical protein
MRKEAGGDERSCLGCSCCVSGGSLGGQEEAYCLAETLKLLTAVTGKVDSQFRFIVERRKKKTSCEPSVRTTICRLMNHMIALIFSSGIFPCYSYSYSYF